MSISTLLVLFVLGALTVVRIESRQSDEPGVSGARIGGAMYAWLLRAVPIGLIVAPALTIVLILAGSRC